MDLMNQVLGEYLDRFINIFIDDILVYSPNVEEHTQYLTLVLQRLREEQLYAKFSKCEFWFTQIGFLSHAVSGDDISVDPEKTEVVMDWSRPIIMTDS